MRPDLLAFQTSTEVLALRRKLGLNQTSFWKPFGVAQSRASRYECGRSIPVSLLALLTIAHGSKSQRKRIIDYLSAQAAKRDTDLGDRRDGSRQ